MDSPGFDVGDGLLDYWRIRLMFSGWVCFPSPSPRSVRRWGLLYGVVNLPGSSVTGPGWWVRPRPRLRPGCMSCQLFVPGCFVEMMAGVDGPTRSMADIKQGFLRVV